MELAKSVAFVEQHGSESERARLRWILKRTEPDPGSVAEFLREQNADGGFAFRTDPGGPSRVGDTLNALWKLEEIGALGSPGGVRALDFLASTQMPDGGWDEDPDIERHDPPPWRRPGQTATRMYLTASALYWVAIAGREPRSRSREACEFLASHQRETGYLPGFPHSTWIGAAALLLAGGEYREPAHRALEALSTKPLPDWVDSQISWALSCFAHAGLRSSDELVGRLIAELSDRQRPDGSWVSEDGRSHDVGATIEAVKVLAHYGVIDPDSDTCGDDAV